MPTAPSNPAPATVADQNIENLIVPLTPGPEIKGVFKTEGTDPASQTQAAKAPPSVQFSVADDSQIYRNVGYGEANDNGTFRMQSVSPSVVRVHVYGLPDNSYVKAINFGGQDYNGKDLDLTSASGGEMRSDRNRPRRRRESRARRHRAALR